MNQKLHLMRSTLAMAVTSSILEGVNRPQEAPSRPPAPPVFPGGLEYETATETGSTPGEPIKISPARAPAPMRDERPARTAAGLHPSGMTFLALGCLRREMKQAMRRERRAQDNAANPDAMEAIRLAAIKRERKEGRVA